MVQIRPDPPFTDSRHVAALVHPQLGHSSAGRAPALEAGGRRFDPDWLHQLRKVERMTDLRHVTRHTARLSKANAMRCMGTLLCLAQVVTGYLLFNNKV